MSKKRGLSAEEKKSRILDLFYEKKDFFQLKELEKLGPKEKGVVSQSVKEIVQSLVDDGLVDSEKIGTSVYFWAFPSKALHTRKRKLHSLEEQIVTLNKNIKKCRTTFDSEKESREECVEREEILSENVRVKEENLSYKNQLQKYKDSDPEAIKQLIKETQELKANANRWIDNIFAIKSWCKRKFNIEEQSLDKQFNIPSDLDYLD